MLDFVYENQTGDTTHSEEFFMNILDYTLTYLKLNDKKVELGLHLITPERSQELNLKYRHKDKPTDVLSFPLDEQNLINHGILPLGDIFICLEVAQHQANESHIKLAEELARLSVHGLLHLVGYDHERSEEEDKKMMTLQEEIVNSIPQ